MLVMSEVPPKKRKRPPRPGEGRPSLYKPEYCQKLIEHMATGLSFESFVAETDPVVDDSTLYRWVNQYPEFCEARKIAMGVNRKFWEKLGVAGAAGKVPGFNPAAWIFNMKNRFRKDWHDQIRVDAQVKGQIDVRVTDESVDKLVDILSTIMDEKKAIDVTPIKLPDNAETKADRAIGDASSHGEDD